MNDKDCSRIANDAGIHFETVLDIFYNKQFLFEKNDPNVKAANQLEKIYSKPSCTRNKKLRTDAKKSRDQSPAQVPKTCNLF